MVSPATQVSVQAAVRRSRPSKVPASRASKVPASRASKVPASRASKVIASRASKVTASRANKVSTSQRRLDHEKHIDDINSSNHKSQDIEVGQRLTQLARKRLGEVVAEAKARSAKGVRKTLDHGMAKRFIEALRSEYHNKFDVELHEKMIIDHLIQMNIIHQLSREDNIRFIEETVTMAETTFKINVHDDAYRARARTDSSSKLDSTMAQVDQGIINECNHLRTQWHTIDEDLPSADEDLPSAGDEDLPSAADEDLPSAADEDLPPAADAVSFQADINLFD